MCSCDLLCSIAVLWMNISQFIVSFGHLDVNKFFLVHIILLWIFVCIIPDIPVQEFLWALVPRMELLSSGFVNVHFTR